MRAVVQRVSRASVDINGETVGEIGEGLLVFLGVAADDGPHDLNYMADKVSGLRIFGDGEGKMNLSVQDIAGGVLCVSQFTLFGDCRKGKRPSFTGAAPPEKAHQLYLQFCERMRETGITVATGRFQAMMDVKAENDGPVTILLDSRKLF